jgi:hypothetical protein
MGVIEQTRSTFELLVIQVLLRRSLEDLGYLGGCGTSR